MADDGHVLGSHWCSSAYYVPHDLGVVKESRPDRHEEYAKHFPDGYEMEFISCSEVKSHEGLLEAFRLNQILAEKAEQKEETNE